MTTERKDEPGPNAAIEGGGFGITKANVAQPLSAETEEAVRNAGAGGLSDYAKQAHAAGEALTITPEEAAAMGAGFVQDVFKTAIDEVVDPPAELTFTSMSPDTAELGSEDVTVSFIGAGFDAASIINFAGQEEPTTLVSDTELTTIVKPTLGWGAVAVPVYIRNAVTQSETLQFTFTEAEPEARSTKRGK